MRESDRVGESRGNSTVKQRQFGYDNSPIPRGVSGGLSLVDHFSSLVVPGRQRVEFTLNVGTRHKPSIAIELVGVVLNRVFLLPIQPWAATRGRTIVGCRLGRHRPVPRCKNAFTA